MKYCIYISDCRKPDPFLRACLDSLADSAATAGVKLITVTTKPVHRGDRRLLCTSVGAFECKAQQKKWWHGIMYAYLQGLAFCRDEDECYVCDDDCLVPAAHYLLPVPWNAIGFNLEIIYLGRRGFFDMYRRGCANMAGCYGHARELRRAFAWKLDEMAVGDFTCYEPAQGGPRPYLSSHEGRTPMPLIDIRIHNRTWAPPEDAVYWQSDPYWGNAAELRNRLGVNDASAEYQTRHVAT